MSNIIDLDSMIPEDITVKLNGKEYKIPTDLDLSTTARLIGLGKKLAEEPSSETVKDFEKFIAELLSIRQKPPNSLKLTMKQALALVKAVTSAEQDAGEQSVPFAD